MNNLSYTTTALHVAIAAMLVGLAGCAVTPSDVKEQVDLKSTQIDNAQLKAATQQAQEPPLTRIKGNFLGSMAQPLANGSSLPATFRDVTLSFGAKRGNLETLATNLRAATGLAVRINPDVFAATVASGQPSGLPTMAPTQPISQPQGMLPGAAILGNAAPFNPVPSANGLGLQTQRPASLSSSPVTASLPTTANTVQLPLSFSGDLADYLNQITSTLGINWEYSTTHGEIHFHRNITRIFTLMIPVGTVSYGDTMNSGGGGTTTGAASSSSAQSSGGATSSVAATFNAWDSVLDTLKTLVSPGGRYAASKASGTLTVTDTRDVLDHVANWIRHENAALMTQVSVDVREITVQLNDQSQIGLDLNLVYQKLNASTGAANWAFKFGAPSTLTDASAGSVGFNLTKPDSRWVGSSIATQALNSFGQVVSDNTETIVTKNRVPGRKQTVTEQAYLASTTPATGGGVSGGTGVPGLTPGLITYGNNLTVIPIIGENNTVSLELFDAQSSLLGISAVSTGSGSTLQQINTPTLARQKISGTYVIGQGETLVIVGSSGSVWTSNEAYGITGASNTGKRIKTMQVLLVTPRILQGS